MTAVRRFSHEKPGDRVAWRFGAAGVAVASSDAAGAFYARLALEQLKVRGILIDDCRHFFGKETIKAELDLMAQHKLNVLHWHLTEDQGWRLDVPGHPEL